MCVKNNSFKKFSGRPELCLPSSQLQSCIKLPFGNKNKMDLYIILK